MSPRWLLSLLVSAPLAAAETDLAALVAKIEATADSSRGMNEEEERLAEDFAAHKTAAADQLLPLLKSEDEDVRQLVSYCLLELPSGSLLERHLPDLMEACRKKRNWLPNAIADIGSDAALEFLAADFRRMPETDAQIDNALERTAPRSVPHLLKEFRQATEEEDDFLNALSKLWWEMGDKAADAVKPLLEMSLDESVPKFRRERAICYLGDIGLAAKSSFASLKQVVANQPEWFGSAVNEAILKSRTSEAAVELLQMAVARTRHQGNFLGFRDLAELGKESGSVGEALVELLDDPDPNIRVGACRALGYTDRVDLWPPLARALKDRDWRVAFCACLGLSHWKAKGALPSLEHLKQSHWYPRVRHAADYAMIVIQGKTPSEDQEEWLGPLIDDEPLSASDFSAVCFTNHKATPLAQEDVEKLGIKPHEGIPWDIRADDGLKIPTFKNLHPKEFEAISAATTKGKDGTWGFFCRLTGRLERDDETLSAFTAGEWVGGLFAVSADKEATLLLDENIQNLLEWNGRWVALSGMNHLGMDEGMVHEVIRDQGRWRVRALHALPGCPLQSGVLADGRLFVNTYGGAVIIGKDGKFEYLGSGRNSEEE